MTGHTAGEDAPAVTKGLSTNETVSDVPATSAASTDLTARNAVQSPLLRLPAELRNLIWDFTFNGTEIDLLNHGEGLHNLALVFKQYWAETLPVILCTSIFIFDDPIVFKRFLKSEHDQVARMHRISIEACVSIEWETDDTKSWASCIERAFTYDCKKLVVRLRMLEDFSLKLHSLMGEDYDLFDNVNVMDDRNGPSQWGGHELNCIIRYFQRFKLKKEFTFCEVQDEGRDRKALEDAIRTHLLDFEGRAYAKDHPSSG